MTELTVATDGACSGNPGPGGWAWVTPAGEYDCGFAPNTTNNAMELTAVLKALRANPGPVKIITDSKLVVNSFTVWIGGWKRRGWRKGNGDPLANLELVQAIDLEMGKRPVTFEWVRGHAGHPLNERADELATAAVSRA